MRDTTFLPVHTLTDDGHADSVVCMAFSPAGTFLASGGEDGRLVLWDTEKGQSVARINMKSPVLCLRWVTDKPEPTVFCGCEDGRTLLVAGSKDVHPPSEVLTGLRAPVYSIDFHQTSSLLAVAIGCELHVARTYAEGVYATFCILPAPEPLGSQNEHAVEGTNVRVRTVKFMPNASTLIAAYLSHGVVAWDIKSKTQLWRISPAHKHQYIGHAMLSPDYRFILLSNLSNGLDLYPLGKSSVLQSYRYTPVPERNFPFTADFVCHGEAVICGSPVGKVSVWKTKTGERVQTLSHDGAVVQSVCGYQGRDFSLIATSTSGVGERTYIKIWRASTDIHKPPLHHLVMLEGGNPVFTTIVYILSTLLFCAVLKFILTGGSGAYLKHVGGALSTTWYNMKGEACQRWGEITNSFWAGISWLLFALVEWTDVPRNPPEVIFA